MKTSNKKTCLLDQNGGKMELVTDTWSDVVQGLVNPTNDHLSIRTTIEMREYLEDQYRRLSKSLNKAGVLVGHISRTPRGGYQRAWLETDPCYLGFTKVNLQDGNTFKACRYWVKKVLGSSARGTEFWVRFSIRKAR